MKVIDRLQDLRRQEHECTVAIIEGLIECHRSKAHVDLGYSKIWPFLVEHLKYSNAAASRRYKAMKCATQFPVVLTMLREHRVSLTTLAKVESLLGQVEDPEALLAAIDGASQHEVDRVVARARPMQAQPREQVRRRFVKAGSVAATRPAADDFFVVGARQKHSGSSAAELAAALAVGGATEPSAPVSSEPAPPSPPPQERITLSFSLSPADYDAFERARAIVSRKTGKVPSVEESLHELVEFFLSKKSPGARSEAREAKSAKIPKSVEIPPAASPTPAHRSRHIPAATRDQVLLRDHERCSFVGASGRRCSAIHDLQVDHIQPFAQGGTHALDNLRVLCAVHNRRRAELTFGSRRVSRRNTKSPPG